jgi:hypothetical protein
MPYNLEFFPESYLALQEEIVNHPRLCELIVRHSPREFELRLAEIATYCNVALDGEYTQEDLNGLCHVLWRKLKEKGTGIILIN